MKLLAPLLIVSPMFAWDCSSSINTSQQATDAYCRGVSAINLTFTLDRPATQTGLHFSTSPESERMSALTIFVKRAEQYYQTCMLANMY